MRITRLTGIIASAYLALVGTEPAIAQEKSILMALYRGETESETVFRARLDELGIKARITVVDAEQDRAKLATRMREIEPMIAAGKFDAIYAYGTPVTQVAAGVVQKRAPIIFNIVFDAVGAKFVDSLATPGGTLSGVTNGVPVGTQLDSFYRLKPFTSLAVFFDARASNANVIQAQVQEWGKSRGVRIEPRRMAPGTPMLEQALGEITSGALPVDAVYAGADSYVAGVAAEIHAAIGGRVLLFGGTQTFVQRGWLAAFTPRVADMGRTAAEQMAKILNGANPATLPVILPTPQLFISKAAAARHGVAVPDDAVPSL